MCEAAAAPPSASSIRKRGAESDSFASIKKLTIIKRIKKGKGKRRFPAKAAEGGRGAAADKGAERHSPAEPEEDPLLRGSDWGRSGPGDGVLAADEEEETAGCGGQRAGCGGSGAGSGAAGRGGSAGLPRS